MSSDAARALRWRIIRRWRCNARARWTDIAGMARQFMVRDDCLKRLRTLCDGDPWKTAFALGAVCQMLDLDHLNEAVEMVEEWSRSEERRVGKECVSTCRSRWSP